MTDVDDIKKYLKKNLSEKRYKHSIGTADQAKALAKQYGADEESAYLAGLVPVSYTHLDVYKRQYLWMLQTV